LRGELQHLVPPVLIDIGVRLNGQPGIRAGAPSREAIFEKQSISHGFHLTQLSGERRLFLGYVGQAIRLSSDEDFAFLRQQGTETL
jgi:hypothetical protein